MRPEGDAGFDSLRAGNGPLLKRSLSVSQGYVDLFAEMKDLGK